jgi:hypothetical protein
LVPFEDVARFAFEELFWEDAFTFEE